MVYLGSLAVLARGAGRPAVVPVALEGPVERAAAHLAGRAPLATLVVPAVPAVPATPASLLPQVGLEAKEATVA